MAEREYIRPTTTRHSSQEDLDAETQRVWEEFWLPIIQDGAEPGDEIVKTDDGLINIGQIKRELCDAQTAFRNLSVVYSEVSGGMVSKPMTDPDGVLDLWREKQNRDFGRDLVEWLEFARADSTGKEWKDTVTRLINLAKREHGMETDDHGV